MFDQDPIHNRTSNRISSRNEEDLSDDRTGRSIRRSRAASDDDYDRSRSSRSRDARESRSRRMTDSDRSGRSGRADLSVRSGRAVRADDRARSGDLADHRGRSSLRTGRTSVDAEDRRTRASRRRDAFDDDYYEGAGRRFDSGNRTRIFDEGDRSRRSGSFGASRSQGRSGSSRSNVGHSFDHMYQDDRGTSGYDRSSHRGSSTARYEDRSRRAGRAGDRYDRDVDEDAPMRSRRDRRSAPDVYVRSSEHRYLSGGRSLPFGSGGFGAFGGGYRGGYSSGGATLPLPVLYALPVVVLILVIALLIFVVSSVQSCSSTEQVEQVTAEEVQPLEISYQTSITALDSIADSGTNVSAFTLASEGQNYLPSLSEEGQSSIQAALSDLQDYDVGFIFMDLQTGSGYSYNVDSEVYGASSFKGPVLIYGCQEALEPGILSISTVDDSASGAIIDSDNDSYYRMRSLFEEYSEISLATWLANMNIDTNLESDTSFPHYTARDSAKLWMNAYQYFASSDSDPDIVSWAQDLFSQTKVSMVRAGVDPSFALVTDGGEVYIYDEQSDQSNDTSGEQTEAGTTQDGDGSTGESTAQGESGQDAASSEGKSAADMASTSITVYDKAGWMNGATDDGICDAGIVIEGDKAYLISVMTGAPDGNENRESVARLIAALWAQRSSLEPAEGYVLIDAAQSSDDAASDATES